MGRTCHLVARSTLTGMTRELSGVRPRAIILCGTFEEGAGYLDEAVSIDPNAPQALI